MHQDLTVFTSSQWAWEKSKHLVCYPCSWIKVLSCFQMNAARCFWWCLGEETNKIFRDEEKNEENWCHSRSHKLGQWPWHLFPLVPPLALHLAMCLWFWGQWRRRELLKTATTIWIQIYGAIYLNTPHVPYIATSQLLWQFPRNKKCALSSCDILYSKLCPVADGSFLKVTYWLWVHVGWVWLCSVFWAHHLLSHSHCHPRPRHHQIGSSSVENYEQIKKDYSSEVNQTTVSTLRNSFGIKFLLQCIFLYFGLTAMKVEMKHCNPAPTKQSNHLLKHDKDRGWVTKASTLPRSVPQSILTTQRTFHWCRGSSIGIPACVGEQHPENPLACLKLLTLVLSICCILNGVMWLEKFKSKHHVSFSEQPLIVCLLYPESRLWICVCLYEDDHIKFKQK